MTRKKVKLAWIANASARRTSLKKRRLGLLKKVKELTTLCGVNACLIIYCPGENEPIVWPSHVEVQRQIQEFYKMPELERLKKTMNQDTYLMERITKAQEQLRKYQRRNKEVEMGHLMHQINQGKVLDEFNLIELQGLIWLVEEKMKEIQKLIDFFQQVPFETTSPNHGDFPLSSQGPGYDPTAQICSASTVLGGDGTLAESSPWDQWFIDIIKNDEFKSGTSSHSMVSDMGLPYYHLFDASSSTTDDLGLQRHSSVGNSSSFIVETGVPPYGNFRGPTSDSRLGLRPLRHMGGSSTESELGGQPFRGGNSSTGAVGSDIGQPPFNGKTWPNNIPP